MKSQSPQQKIRTIPITDLGKEYTLLRNEVDPALQRVLVRMAGPIF